MVWGGPPEKRTKWGSKNATVLGDARIWRREGEGFLQVK